VDAIVTFMASHALVHVVMYEMETIKEWMDRGQLMGGKVRGGGGGPRWGGGGRGMVWVGV
jgi:hypothetical protein